MEKVSEVGERELGKRTSKRVDPTKQVVTLLAGMEGKQCFWNDVEFQPGALVSVPDGARYVCKCGYWEKETD